MPVGHYFPDVVSLNYSGLQLNIDGSIYIDPCHLIWSMQSWVHLCRVIVLNPNTVSNFLVIINPLLVFSDQVSVNQLLLPASDGIKVSQEGNIDHHVSVEYKGSWRGSHCLIDQTLQGMNAAV